MLKKIVRKIENLILIYRINTNKESNISFRSRVDKLSQFEGRNIVYSKTSISESEIGTGTYISAACTFNKTKIGKYCSIAPYVEVIAGNHPTTDFVSTHPLFYTNKNFAGLSFETNITFDEYSFTDNNKKYFCEIGNDVWVGQNVKILNGVTIGDGAVIAAGAIVDKSVPPYAIVGGIPAKIIRYRFDESEIEYLLKLKWWNKDYYWLSQHVSVFHDIKELRRSEENNV